MRSVDLTDILTFVILKKGDTEQVVNLCGVTVDRITGYELS